MTMKCLIDADILSYEISSCGQYYEPEDTAKENLVIRPFDQVADLLDQKIREIIAECNSNEEPTLYLTGDEHLIKLVNNQCRWLGENARLFKPNFRHDVAKTKPYKGNRKQEKPYHFHNLRAYMLSQYDCIVTEGMEADDLICIHMFNEYKMSKLVAQYGFNSNVICCTRDKDLRMCPGWHYGWQCGKQEQFGPILLDEFGHLELSEGKPKKLRGTGLKFFFSQLLTGDTVDNISGLPKCGPVKGFNVLNKCQTEEELFEQVRLLYSEYYGGIWEEKLREQVDLLWMIREVNEDGSLKFYEWPTNE